MEDIISNFKDMIMKLELIIENRREDLLELNKFLLQYFPDNNLKIFQMIYVGTSSVRVVVDNLYRWIANNPNKITFDVVYINNSPYLVYDKTTKLRIPKLFEKFLIDYSVQFYNSVVDPERELLLHDQDEWEDGTNKYSRNTILSATEVLRRV